MSLEPVNQLVAEDGAYRSLGEDPQFDLRSSLGRLPTGWVEITYEVGHASQPLDASLYVDSGTGYSERERFNLPFTFGGPVRWILRLPGRVRSLRLAPLPSAGHFAMRNLRIREIQSIGNTAGG